MVNRFFYFSRKRIFSPPPLCLKQNCTMSISLTGHLEISYFQQNLQRNCTNRKKEIEPVRASYLIQLSIFFECVVASLEKLTGKIAHRSTTCCNLLPVRAWYGCSFPAESQRVKPTNFRNDNFALSLPRLRNPSPKKL